ncbi:MAG TPA: YbhB/YbcL family Raf kinase inhibitor-like protein [Terriglobales bacterium]|jgi:Raf kinase inhibitor-like YbhB/YbcL family protein|nr:YbhB/YbcL family Raf kinase inhibitor-like protein [Terriglobales bacterium]
MIVKQGSAQLEPIVAIAALLIALPTTAIAGKSADPSPAQGGRTMALVISTPSFPNAGDIPRKFTCDGADLSPELSWTGAPAGTQAFALIADDPDAPVGTWTHWVLYDLPASATSLPEGVSKVDELGSGGHQGRNDFRKIGYGGPCPPPGKPHRYFFKLYALDTKLNLKPGASKREVEQAMEGHVLAQAEWMGKYKR